MKLVLLFIIISSDVSWQQKSTETINETLDRLIHQGHIRSVNGDSKYQIIKNNTKIFLIKPPASHNKTHSDKPYTKLSFKSDDVKQSGVSDILYRTLSSRTSGHIEEKNEHETNKNKIHDANNLELNQNTKQQADTSSNELKEMIKYFRATPEIPSLETISKDAIVSYDIKFGNQKYPDIFIDHITYRSNDSKKPTEANTMLKHKYDQSTEAHSHNDKEFLTKEDFKSVLEEILNMNADRNEIKNVINGMKPHNTDIQVPDKQKLCGIIPYQYPCPNGNIALGELSEHQQLHPMIHQIATPHLDTSLQFNRWGPRNAMEDALMRVSSAQRLKRINLINNIVPRFVYNPLYG